MSFDSWAIVDKTSDELVAVAKTRSQARALRAKLGTTMTIKRAIVIV